MAIIENKSTEVGDVMLIRADAPIVGIVALSDFADQTIGEQVDRSFLKEFRYATDGINFSNWLPLTNQNVSGIEISSEDTFVAEYRYTRQGSNSLGEIEFVEVSLNGEFIALPCGENYKSSIFNDFFSCNNTEVLSWCINVTEKLYESGIVPEYISRGDANNINGSDKDYLDFWRSIACFFAFIVVFVRKIESFKTVGRVAQQFLSQRGIITCGSESNSQTESLISNLLKEASKRGTKQIYKTTSTIDGELLRLICFNKDTDEFIINAHLPFDIGLVGDRYSPIDKTVTGQPGANKLFENTKGIVDNSLYPVVNLQYVDFISDNTIDLQNPEDTNNTIRVLNSPASSESGLGGSSNVFRKVIDDDVSYELTFKAKIFGSGSIKVGINAFDISGNSISLKNISNNADSNFFFTDLSLPIVGRYYFIRCIVYGKNINSSSVQNKPNIGIGNNLKFQAGTYKLIPQILLVSSAATDQLQIYDIKLNPVSFKYSNGFVSAKNFINLWLKNNSGALSDAQVENRIRKDLLPYDSDFSIENLKPEDNKAIGDMNANQFSSDFNI